MTPGSTVAFSSVARLAAPADNVAIAIRQLDAGTVIQSGSETWTLSHTVLEGHRFAVHTVRGGEDLRSWGQPFGRALIDLAPGTYLCNRSMLEALKVRGLPFSLPAEPNFEDRILAFQLDEAAFKPGAPVPLVAAPRTFQGYVRPGGRGVGTRNCVVILGTTSRTASAARQLAARLQPLARVHPGIDGIVAIAHTEGGGPDEPNNAAEILRAMAGFMVHPNVGAILALDHGTEPVNNARLETFLRAHGYPLDAVPHAFITLSGSLAAGLAEGERLVRGWLGAVNAMPRTAAPVSALRVALQCGGSDAFSGVSGNPLAGALVHEVVRHGGAGVLCETDELIGAEGYILGNVRDLSVARTLLGKIAAFKERLAWHGVTPEANPSAGNKFRGLYNIVLKSLGAVHKKDPRSRVEAVIDYAEPIRQPGFQFMHSPGNDLEGIAGQVGAGCNLFLFVTGNGSITNFPFVPTLKLTTTTRRHQLLQHEMDINAGRYLDGESMEALTAESFDLLIDTASGKKTKGEHAGHSQVSLWRNWRQTDTSKLAELALRTAPDGHPLLTAADVAPASASAGAAPVTLSAYPITNDAWATDRIGLILPTSLCATQIARLAAERLNRTSLGAIHGISRFATLLHTEGCGFGGQSMYQLLHRTYRGYATHPNVAATLLLEHGCEKIPNDAMRRQFEAANLPLNRFGWASVQLDGGIDKALGKIEAWFETTLAATPPPAALPTGLGALTLGFQTAAPVRPATAAAFASIARTVIAGGGSILLPESDPLLAQPAFADRLLGGRAPRATLAYGQPLEQRGLHVVATETSHWAENLAGLGGCGAHLFLTVVADQVGEGHPLIPVLQFAEAGAGREPAAEDVDGRLPNDAAAAEALLLARLQAVVSHAYTPTTTALGLTHFQLTRGLLGIST
ncbi:MAG TPA: UxaA family hydrolase [Opitutaceae bacterium]